MDPHPSTRFQALVDAIVRKTTRLTSFFEAVGRTTRLNALVAALDRRFGPQALRRLRRTARDIQCVSTGFSSIDEILEVGGVPRGHMTEFLGAPTCGATTVALTSIASAQAAGDTAAYVDLDCTFDPAYAAHCGVVVSDLLLVRPEQNALALDIVYDLVADGIVGILVFDSLSSLIKEEWNQLALPSALRRLTQALSASPCVLIFLTHLPPSAAYRTRASGDVALAQVASLRLQFFHRRWVWDRYELYGYETAAVVQKSKLGRPGGKTTVTISTGRPAC